MSDLHDHDPAAPEPDAVDGAAGDDTGAPGDGRPDPRLRPPDPAGTQPRWDPDELLPKTTPRAAAGRLWAPEAERADGDDAGAEDHHDDREALAATAPAAATGGRAPSGGAEDHGPRFAPYSGRFQFLLGGLLAVGAAAIVLLVAGLVTSGSDDHGTVALKSGPAWSDWTPSAAGGIEAAEDIAEHVGQKYRLPNGQQLVGVTPTALQYGDVPLTIAIDQPAAQGGIDFLNGTGVWFHMCDVNGKGGSTTGTSEDCAIRFGKPSKSRHMLLRREALELALYSFRYLGVNDVVVSLPPARIATKDASGKETMHKDNPQALLFRRDQSDLRTALDHQLTATLSTRTPSVSTVTRWPDAQAVRTLTNSRVFNYRLQASNTEARGFMVMTPLP